MPAWDDRNLIAMPTVYNSKLDRRRDEELVCWDVPKAVEELHASIDRGAKTAALLSWDRSALTTKALDCAKGEGFEAPQQTWTASAEWYVASVLSANAAVAAYGSRPPGAYKPFRDQPAADKLPYSLSAYSRADGKILWTAPLSGQPLMDGLSIARDGSVIVRMLDGSVVCFAKECSADNQAGQPRGETAKTEQQEICVLINVIDHDYEKISPKTFAELSAMGYKTIELGNYTKPFSPQLAKTYDGLRFNTLSSGASLAELRRSLDDVIKQALARKQKYVICYWPWLDGATHVTLEQCKQSAAIMDAMGEKCRQAGLKFAFHNHEVEFSAIDGKMICDILLENTRPDRVRLELDLYHMLKAHHDPLPYMETQKSRIDILHLFTLDEKAAHPVAGAGMLDFEGIIKKSRAIGVRYLVVEGNDLKDPMRYLRESHQRLSKLTGN